jgi:LysM repeat protein
MRPQKMNKPNPLIPQGTFPDNRGRSHIRLAVFTILAVHLVLLSALLMAGCKKTAEESADGKGISNTYSNVNLAPDTNPPVPVPTVVVSPPTNVVVPPPPVPDSGTSFAGTEHVVMKGDSFYTLAKKYNVSTKAITDSNPGVDSAKLKIGQKLKIPAASAGAASAAHSPSNGSDTSNGIEKNYTVKSGDNLMKIAKVNGITVKSLRSANALKTDQIKVGQKLKIPSRASASEPAGPAAGTPTVTATSPAQ